MPWVASPAENVTACCSAIPTSNVLSGISFIMIFKEQPEGMAGVMPAILMFNLASSSIVLPNTSW